MLVLPHEIVQGRGLSCEVLSPPIFGTCLFVFGEIVFLGGVREKFPCFLSQELLQLTSFDEPTPSDFARGYDAFLYGLPEPPGVEVDNRRCLNKGQKLLMSWPIVKAHCCPSPPFTQQVSRRRLLTISLSPATCCLNLVSTRARLSPIACRHVFDSGLPLSHTNLGG